MQRVTAFPEPVRQHGVRIGEVVYPVKQAFELATGLPRTEFTTHIARRHLAALGFEVVGEIETRGPIGGLVARVRHTRRWNPKPSTASGIPNSECRQPSFAFSSATGGRSRPSQTQTLGSMPSTFSPLRGGDRAAIEVQGFPSRNYADPARASETKRTQPSTQCEALVCPGDVDQDPAAAASVGDRLARLPALPTCSARLPPRYRRPGSPCGG